MTTLTLGLLPSAGGGLASLAATGQSDRLIDYYFPTYLETFERLYYFSYQREVLTDYTNDSDLLEGVSLIPKLKRTPYRVYAFQMPFVAKPQFKTCGVLRVFQATGAVPAMIARLLYGIPYVTTYGYRYHTFAAMEGRYLNSLYLRVLELLALRLAVGVIVTTQELASYVGHFLPAEKIHLIPNGVDTALFSPSKETCTGKNGVRTILFVGRLTRQKNLMRLLEALSVLNEHHSVQLQIIGEGPLQRTLEETATQLRVDCTFEGTVPHHSLPDYMNCAGMFVLPSLVEGHPKALIEAMSCGMPCVVSDCEGNRALIEHEKTGLLFDPNDIVGMTAQLERVIDDDCLAEALGRAARQHVCKSYDLQQLLEREVVLLQALAKKTRTMR